MGLKTVHQYIGAYLTPHSYRLTCVICVSSMEWGALEDIISNSIHSKTKNLQDVPRQAQSTEYSPHNPQDLKNMLNK